MSMYFPDRTEQATEFRHSACAALIGSSRFRKIYIRRTRQKPLRNGAAFYFTRIGRPRRRRSCRPRRRENLRRQNRRYHRRGRISTAAPRGSDRG